MNARTRLATVALLVGPVIYLAAEALSALAWTNPAYSYLHNWISDLGSTTQGEFQGRLVNSPLHDVMNAGFILQGALFALGTVLLARYLPGKLHAATAGIGTVVGLGYVLLGIFHGSADAAADGSLALHFTGAGIAILGANVLALVLGIHWWRNPATRRLGHASAPLGAVGLVATIVLVASFGTDLPSGLIERLAVYPIVLWQIRVALQLLLRAPIHATTEMVAAK